MIVLVRDGETSTRYRRGGACRKCGKCCEYDMNFVRHDNPYDGSVWILGSEYSWDVKDIRPRSGPPCKCFDETTRMCTCPEGERAPGGVCELWPFDPRRVIPGCGFRFEVL
jgi:hypothetical protein